MSQATNLGFIDATPTSGLSLGGGGGAYDMMPEPELGTSDWNGKFSRMWD